MNTPLEKKKKRARTPEEAIEHAKEHENIGLLLTAAKRKILLPRKYKGHSGSGRRSHTKAWYQKIIDILEDNI